MNESYTDNTPLRKARIRARLTQDELAVRAGVSRDTVYRAEKADSEPPTFRVQRRLAAVLEMSADELWPMDIAA